MQSVAQSIIGHVSATWSVRTPSRLTACAALAASVAVGGCASLLSGGAMPAAVAPTVDRQSAASRGDPILAAEIQAASSTTAYDAVLKLRPRFFTGDRPTGTGRPPILPSVVLGRGFTETVDVLRLVPADEVAEIRFVEPGEALITYGAAYTAGVIVVRLRASP